MTALQPTYPALEPTSRTWVGGQPGQDIFTAASGIETRIMFGGASLRPSPNAELRQHL